MSSRKNRSKAGQVPTKLRFLQKAVFFSLDLNTKLLFLRRPSPCMKFLFQLLLPAVFILNSAFTGSGSATERSVSSIENDLVQLFRNYTASPYASSRDSLAKVFRNELTGLLASERSLTFSFDSLRKYMNITQSADGRFRTFSWDEKEGSAWHNMTAYAQFRGGDGLLHIEQLDTDTEDVSGSFTDVNIYSIHMVERNGRTAYLVIGSGTHGGGLHHATSRLFTIGHNRLELCSDAFNGKPELVTEIPRTYPIAMSFDAGRQVLSYNDYSWSDASAGKSRCLHSVELKLMNGRFKK